MSSGSWAAVELLSGRALDRLQGDMVDDREVIRAAQTVIDEAKTAGELAEDLRLNLLLDQVRSEVWDLLHDQVEL